VLLGGHDSGLGQGLQPPHQVCRSPLDHQIKVGQAAPGVVVHPVQQQIAHRAPHQRQPRPAGRLQQQRRQRGWNAW
jgi:hypothetical protein